MLENDSHYEEQVEEGYGNDPPAIENAYFYRFPHPNSGPMIAKSMSGRPG
jgi:hypothetical protein